MTREDLFQPSAFILHAQRFEIAWLSLDDDDNDPGHFFYALVAAVQRLCSSCGEQSRTILAGSGQPAEAIRRAMSSLSNELLALGQPVALVLDDFHLLTEPAIHQALDYFVEHLPPSVPLPLSRRVKSQINLVWSNYYQRDWPQFERSLAVTLADVMASGDKGAHQSVVLSLGPQYIFGGAAPIEQFCRRVLALFGEGVGPAQTGALAYLSYIYALQGRPDEALQVATQAQASE
jgi:hypothetical protein